MLIQTILSIIDRLLEIHLERLKHMPPEQAEQYWARFERRMDFWEGLLDKLPVPPGPQP